MELLAWLETDSFPWCNADLRASPWIASNTCLSRADAEHAKTSQFDAIACCQCLLEALKNGIDSRFSLGPRQACPFNNVMDNILLNQCRRPLLEEFPAGIRSCPLARCYCELAPLSISAHSNTIA